MANPCKQRAKYGPTFMIESDKVASPPKISGRKQDRDIGKSAERRWRRRHLYNRVQYIAYQTPDGDVLATSFQAVQCHDLSNGGLSFFAAEMPPSNFLCVALGTPPQLTYLRAEVRYIKRLSASRFHIGCKFLNRVDPPTA